MSKKTNCELFEGAEVFCLLILHVDTMMMNKEFVNTDVFQFKISIFLIYEASIPLLILLCPPPLFIAVQRTIITAL